MDVEKERFTQKSLCEHTGFSRPTINKLRRENGAPESNDPDEWDIWLDKHPEVGLAGNRVSKDREHWLTEQAEHRARLLQIERQRADGDVVMKADLDARDQRVALAQRTALYEILTNELPVKSEGKTAVEIRALNRDAADRVCLLMQQKLNDWARADEG